MSRISDASATRRNRSALTALAVAGTLALGGAATAPRAEAATRTPVVFVHGYAESPSNWSAAKASFEAAGYPASDLFTYQYTWTQSNKTSAQGLASYVQQVLATTGASQVDIVNHSMGGMVTNWYVNELGGQPYVKHMASLVAPTTGAATPLPARRTPRVRRCTPARPS